MTTQAAAKTLTQAQQTMLDALAAAGTPMGREHVRADRKGKGRLVVKAWLLDDVSIVDNYLAARGLLDVSVYKKGSVKHVRIVEGIEADVLDLIEAGVSAVKVRALVKKHAAVAAQAKVEVQTEIQTEVKAWQPAKFTLAQEEQAPVYQHVHVKYSL